MRKILLSTTMLGAMICSLPALAGDYDQPYQYSYDYNALTGENQSAVDGASADHIASMPVSDAQQQQVDDMLKNAQSGGYTSDIESLANSMEAATQPGGVMTPPTAQQSADVNAILTAYSNGSYDRSAEQDAAMGTIANLQQSNFMQGTALPDNPLPDEFTTRPPCEKYYPVQPQGTDHCEPTYEDAIVYFFSGYGDFNSLIRTAVGGEYAQQWTLQNDLWRTQYSQLNKESPNQMKCFYENVGGVLNGTRPADIPAAFADGSQPYTPYCYDTESSYYCDTLPNRPLFELNGSNQTSFYQDCRGLTDPELAANKQTATSIVNANISSGVANSESAKLFDDVTKKGIYINEP